MRSKFSSVNNRRVIYNLQFSVFASFVRAVLHSISKLPITGMQLLAKCEANGKDNILARVDSIYHTLKRPPQL